MTTLEEQSIEHQRWMQRLLYPAPVYDRLLENEFETPERYRARTAANLGGMLRFASGEVPHYRDAFRRANIETVDTDRAATLTALPILSKLDVLDAGRALLAENVAELIDAAGVRTAAANLAFIAFAGYETTVHLPNWATAATASGTSCRL